jgi:hypothetical protein
LCRVLFGITEEDGLSSPWTRYLRVTLDALLLAFDDLWFVNALVFHTALVYSHGAFCDFLYKLYARWMVTSAARNSSSIFTLKFVHFVGC